MQLEVGKSYRTRDGERVDITDKRRYLFSSLSSPNRTVCYYFGVIPAQSGGKRGECWENGSFLQLEESPKDLIAEWEEPAPSLFASLPKCPAGLSYGTEKEIGACDTCYLAKSCFKFSDALASLKSDRDDEDARIIAEKEKILAAEAKEKLGPNFFEKNRRHCLAMIAGMAAYRKALEE